MERKYMLVYWELLGDIWFLFDSTDQLITSAKDENGKKAIEEKLNIITADTRINPMET